jgi:hypothetical protein
MASRSGAASFDIHGVDEVRRLMTRIAREDLNPAKRDLRQGTKKIAQEVLIPALKMSALASGVPIAPKMADTMRARTDRIINVRVGAVNPRLSGFRKGVGVQRAPMRRRGNAAASSQGYRTTLAWGSERGPWPNGRAVRKNGSAGAPVNHYGVARSRSHWVASGANAPGTWRALKDAYQDLLNRILRNYGADR